MTIPTKATNDDELINEAIAAGLVCRSADRARERYLGDLFNRLSVRLQELKGHPFPSGVRCRGIGRDAENSRSLVLLMTDIPGDEDIRALHYWLTHRPAWIDAAWEDMP